MDKSIKRTEQEIDEIIRKGQEFVKEHPQSMFGDDNVEPFEFFKILCQKAKKGYSASMLRREIEREYADEEDEDERMHLENMAEDDVDWLAGESDEAPY